MSQKLWNIAFSDTDPNTAIVKLNEVITYCFERFCRHTKIKRARKSWVTNQVLRASRKGMSSTKYILKIQQQTTLSSLRFQGINVMRYLVKHIELTGELNWKM